MARSLRVEFQGACYHVINRGVERRVIFMDDGDAGKFLEAVGEFGRRHQVALLAYCLMPNHYHLLLRTDGGILTKFMRDLNGLYAQHVNKKLNRVGPLFQGRYKAVLVGDERYLRAIVRYIHRNPVGALLASRPEEYPWSSCAQYYGMVGRGSPLQTAMVLGLFGNSDAESVAGLKKYTEGETGPGEMPPGEVAGGILLGSESFRREVQRDHVPSRPNRNISRLRELRRPGPEILQSMAARVRATGVAPTLAGKLLVYALHAGTSLSLAEIAAMTGAKSASAVGMVVRRLEVRRSMDPAVDRVMTGLVASLRGSQTQVRRPQR